MSEKDFFLLNNLFDAQKGRKSHTMCVKIIKENINEERRV